MLSLTKGGSILINFLRDGHGSSRLCARSKWGNSCLHLRFYDKFIDSLHEFFGSQGEKRKEAFKYLSKLGLGWLFRFYSKLRKI